MHSNKAIFSSRVAYYRGVQCTVHSGYKGHVYIYINKGQSVIRDRLAGTESFPFLVV